MRGTGAVCYVEPYLFPALDRFGSDPEALQHYVPIWPRATHIPALFAQHIF
jgi:hypothetical protein